MEVAHFLFQFGLAAAKIVSTVCFRFDKAVVCTGSVWIWGDVIAQAFCKCFLLLGASCDRGHVSVWCT